jgi:hypothetical protein
MKFCGTSFPFRPVDKVAELVDVPSRCGEEARGQCVFARNFRRREDT